MPTVWRELGFDIVIYTDDHMPMHVHCWKGGKVVLINLGDAENAPSVRRNKRMKKADARRVVGIVAEQQDYLIQRWVSIHGIPE